MISIIVPVYNAALFLTDCVDSLLGQTTIEPLEIILIDDGSTGLCQEARGGPAAQSDPAHAATLRAIYRS